MMPFSDYYVYVETGPSSFQNQVVSEFSSGQGPEWFSSLPSDVQTWFVTDIMAINQGRLDWGGTDVDTYSVAMLPTTVDGTPTTVITTASFA